MRRIVIIATLALASVALTAGSAAAATPVLINPGFETGSVLGWNVTWTGNGQPFATTSYQTYGRRYTAPDGRYFAVVPAGCHTNAISQSFLAHAGDTLSGWFFFQANDYIPFNDSGSVQLTMNGGGSGAVVAQSSVNQVGSFGDTPWEQWSYTFPSTGTYTLQIQSTNWGDCALSSAAGVDLPAGPPPETPITVTGKAVSATEGQSFHGAVATVSGDSDSAASDYTVSIDWGDGSISSGSVDSSGNVIGSHTYADEGSHTVKTTVTDTDQSSNTASGSSTATVADAALSAGQMSASGGTEGTGGGSASFSFTDANPNATAADFTATVDWGDGSSSNGTVTKNADGSFSVSAPGHTYAEEGKNTVKVSVSDDGGSKTSGSQDVTVADAALSATGKTINSQPAFSGTVASFTDANPNGSVADFTATIDWGDGSSSQGTVSQNGSGGFDVSGSHTYAQTGPYTVKVHVADDGGSTADATTSILVYQFAASNGGSFAIGDGNVANGSQVTFWGAQWAGQNSLSSGSAPASFKGFGDNPSSNPPACGGSYSTAPGNSSSPPASVPAYMGVYVSSRVSKQGSKISGDIKHLVIVKTDSGYQPDPGHAGTGQVVAEIC